MPVQATDIDQEIAYILQYWIQNNNQLITGTIGQNVVWNLAQFIKQLPENYQRASVVTNPVINYTTNNNECIVIFTNNSTGKLAWVDNRWNKYVFVNATDNIRLFFNGKFYWSIAGNAVVSLAPRTSITLAKGNDDYWYEINAGVNSAGVVRKPLIGIAGGAGANDPVVGAVFFQSVDLLGLGSSNAGSIRISINSINMDNFGINSTFSFDNTLGIILFNVPSFPFVWTAGDSIYIDLNQ